MSHHKIWLPLAMTSDIVLRIEPARKTDTPVILRMIQALVDYERLTHEFSVTESILERALFGAQPVAEVALGYVGAEPVGFAAYSPTFSTASGQTGLYLEDLYVEPQWRSRGIGRTLFAHVARLAAARGGGSLMWSVLNWNGCNPLLPVPRSGAGPGLVDLPPGRTSLRAADSRGPLIPIWTRRRRRGGLSQ